MTIVTLGIDLGKTLCSLAGLDEEDRVVLRRAPATRSVGGFHGQLVELHGGA
jgi:molecular chaperone DnaK (HSP70)